MARRSDVSIRSALALSAGVIVCSIALVVACGGPEASSTDPSARAPAASTVGESSEAKISHVADVASHSGEPGR